MKKMILNIALIWGITALTVIVLTVLFSLLYREAMGLVILPMHLACFAIPVACAVSGILSARGNTSFLLSAGIAVVWTIVFISVFYPERGYSSLNFFVLSPLIFNIVAFAVMKAHSLISTTKYASINAGLLIISSAAVFCALYAIAAFNSQLAYSPFDGGNFFFYPQSSVNVALSEDGIGVYVLDEANRPYTGTREVYAKKLKINPFPPTVSGINYYIGGYYYGNSGSRYYNDPLHGKPEVQYLTSFEIEGPFLHHKDYQAVIEKEMAGWGEFYYTEILSGSDDAHWFAVVLTEAGGLPVKRLITFHDNGVIASIKVSCLTENGWGRYEDEREIKFDSLGFAGKQGNWSKDDFIESRFDAKAFLAEHTTRKEKIIKRFTSPEKFDYAPYPERGIHEDLFDNMVIVYDIPDEELSITAKILNREGEYQWMGEEFEKMRDLINLGRLSIDAVHADYHSESNWTRQKDSVRIRITSPKKNKKMYLHYYDGCFYIHNGPYYIDIRYLPENASEADEHISLWKEVMAIFEQYTGKELTAQ